MVFNVFLKMTYKFVTMNTEFGGRMALLLQKCLQFAVVEVWWVSAL